MGITLYVVGVESFTIPKLGWQFHTNFKLVFMLQNASTGRNLPFHFYDTSEAAKSAVVVRSGQIVLAENHAMVLLHTNWNTFIHQCLSCWL